VVHQKSPFSLKDAGLILNPKGGKNTKEAFLLLAFAKHAGLEIRLGSNFKELLYATEKLLSLSKKILFISGGDGTVSAVLTACLRKGRKPAFAVLPGGTTNLIAWDVSRPRGQLSIFQRFLKGFPPLVRERKALRIEPHGLYGLFCGAGLLAEGVRLYNLRRIRSGKRGLKNALPVTLRLLLKGVKNGRESLIFGSPPQKAQAAIFTTLEKVFVSLRPFFQKPCAEIKVGLFPRTILPLFVSCEEKIALRTEILALDGEIIENKGVPFIIKAADRVVFYTW